MGNEASSLPADIPEELHDVIVEELLNGQKPVLAKDGGGSKAGKGVSRFRSDLSEEQIQQMIVEALDGKKKTRHSRKKRVGRDKRIPKSISTGADDSAGPAFSRSGTDSQVASRRPKNKSGPGLSRSNTTDSSGAGAGRRNKQSLQDAWNEQKQKRAQAETIREELDPQAVIQLLEKYSTMDRELAKDFFQSLKHHHHEQSPLPTGDKHTRMPKAA